MAYDKNNYIGVAMGMDVSDLKSGIAEANRTIQLANSEFKAAASGMDDWTKSTEGLQAKISQLDTVLTAQKAKLAGLQAEYNKVASEQGESSEAARRLQVQINNQQAVVNKTSRELDNYRETLGKAEDGSIDLNEVTLKAGKAFEKAGAKAKDADGDVEKLGNSAKDAGDGFTVAKGAIAGFIANGLSSLVESCKGAISTLFELSESTREYRDDIAKLNTAFEVAGHTTQEAAATYEELYSVFGEEDRAVEAAQQIANIARNEEDMTRMTNIATGAWARWGDSLATESLMEAISSTSKIGEVQGTLADALEWSGVNLDEFNERLAECNGEEERTALILDTLDGLYSDYADNYRTTNKEVIKARKSQSQYNDVMAELGEELEPVNASLVDLKTEFAKELTPVIKRDVVPAIKNFFKELKNSGAIKDVAKMIGDLATGALPPLASILSFIIDNWKALALAVSLAVTAFSAMSIISTVTTAIQGATTATAAFNAVLAANPIGAVITAVVGLIAVFATLISMARDVKTNIDYVNDAVQANIDANSAWQESMDAAKMELGDYSEFTNQAGETTADLEEKMSNAQANITEIYANAFNENRQLRSDEIESIRQFNEEYLEAQTQLAQLEQQIYKAQLDAMQWKLDNMNLTEEQEQGILNSMNALREEHLAKLDELVANELVLLDMRLSNNQITQEEYNTLREQALAKLGGYAAQESTISQGLVDDALARQRERIQIEADTFENLSGKFSSELEIYEYYAAKIKEINEDETLSHKEKQQIINSLNTQANVDAMNFKYGQEVFWNDYNFLTDEQTQKNLQAYFNWVGNVKEQGQELDAENQEIARLILAAYENLPDDLQEAGLNSLLGLAEGMSDQYPEVEKAAEGDMDDLIAAMRNSLGVKSPSVIMKGIGENVMQGLSNGMNNKLPSLRTVVTDIGTSLINGFKNMFDIHSPSGVAEGWGANIMKGLINGLDDGRGDLRKHVKGIGGDVSETLGNIKSNLRIRTSGSYGSGTHGGYNPSGYGNRPTIVNAGMTVNYNGKLSRRKLKQLEDDNYTSIRMRLKKEGAF